MFKPSFKYSDVFDDDCDSGYSDKGGGGFEDPSFSFLDRVLASSSYPVRPFEEVKNPLPMVSHLSDAVMAVLEHVPPQNEIFTKADVPKPSHSHLSDIVTGFKKVLDYDFKPVAVAEKQDIVSKAVVAPLVGFIHHEVSTRGGLQDVLLLGAGTGKDIMRLIKSTISMTVTAVEPDEAHVEMLRRIPNIEVIAGTFKQALHKLKNRKYDVIIANMSLHYMLGVESAPLLVSFLNGSLKSTGVMYGSFFDVPTIKAVGLSKTTQYGHSVQYLGDDPAGMSGGEKVVRSLARVSVAGRVFADPIVEVSDVYTLFEKAPNLDLNVYSGNDVVYGASGRGAIYTVESHFDAAIARAELGFLRCVIIRRPPIMHPCGANHSPTPHVLQASTIDGIALTSTTVELNHGRPAKPHDLMYFDAGTSWIAEKKDGITGRLTYKQGAIRLLMNDGTSYKYSSYSGKCPVSFTLQVEKINEEVVVTDVLVPPWGQTGSFISRWRWLECIVDRYQFPFTIQRWLTSDPTPELLNLVMTAKEGVVLQSILAPPSHVRGKAGSARYIKRFYTVDVMQGDKVVETHLDGTFIRDRPDKLVPNTPIQVYNIVKALQYTAFMSHVFNKVIGTVGASWKQLGNDLAAYKPPQQWTDEQLLLYHTHRETHVVKELVTAGSAEVDNAVVTEIRNRFGVQAATTIRPTKDMFDDLEDLDQPTEKGGLKTASASVPHEPVARAKVDLAKPPVDQTVDNFYDLIKKWDATIIMGELPQGYTHAIQASVVPPFHNKNKGKFVLE